MKLVKRLNDDKPKLKSPRHQFDKRYKEQLEYFENFVKLELGIHYTKLYYQLGSKKNGFNINEFGSMFYFYQRLRTGEMN